MAKKKLRKYVKMAGQMMLAIVTAHAIQIELFLYRIEDAYGRIYIFDYLTGRYRASRKKNSRIRRTVNNRRRRNSAVGTSGKSRSYTVIPMRYDPENPKKYRRPPVHQVVALLNEHHRRLRKQAFERAGEGCVVEVNHMNFWKRCNYAYNLEWTTRSENGSKHFKLARKSLEDGNRILPCKHASEKFGGRLLKPVSVTAECEAWAFGDFFSCGITEAYRGKVYAPDYYSQMLSAKHLPVNTDTILVSTPHGECEIRVSGATVWEILADMFKADATAIVGHTLLS